MQTLGSHPRTTESESLWGGSYNINRHLLWWWYAVRLGIPCSRWYLVSLPPMKLVEQWKFGWRASVQSLSHIRLFATLRTAARQASLSITNSWSLLKLMSIELMSVKTSAIWAVTYTIHQKHSLDPIVLFFNFNFFKLGITTLQYCVDFFHIATWSSHR